MGGGGGRERWGVGGGMLVENLTEKKIIFYGVVMRGGCEGAGNGW